MCMFNETDLCISHQLIKITNIPKIRVYIFYANH